MKSPPKQVTDGVAHQLTEAFIAGTSVDTKAPERVEAVPAAEGNARR
jgi:hypothetical protein